MSNDQSRDSKSEDVAVAPAPFTGANIASTNPLMRPADVYADHPVAGVATPNAPSGGRDESIPVTQGNQHMLLGTGPEDIERANQPEGGQSSIGGPGTDNPNAGITRTVGQSDKDVEPIRQVDNTVIIPEDTRDKNRPEFAPGLPRPRTDPDADPHEKTDPGFQGFDKINPLPLPGAAESIEHRGNPNEPRVVGVQTVGEGVRVVGSESSEAKAIDGGASPEEVAVETLRPSAPDAEPSEGDEADDAHPKSGKLPEDFPYRSFLEAEGVTTFAKLRKRIEAGTLTDIPNIADERAAQIEAAVNE